MSTLNQNIQADNKEVRVYHSPNRLQVRKKNGSKTISGTAVVYNAMSEDLGFREVIKPGAFTKSLRDNPDVFILKDHSMAHPLGRVSSGTATVTDTPTGLNFTCRLPNTSYANDLAVSASRGDVRSMSFGFSVPDGGDRWSVLADGSLLREVNEAMLYELSCVSMPAYSQSSFGVRAAALRSCPVELRSKANRAALDSTQGEDENTGDGEEARCQCRCGLGGCVSSVSPEEDDDENLDADATNDELVQRSKLVEILMRRASS
jgi:HK97 family phage prohead protease